LLACPCQALEELGPAPRGAEAALMTEILIFQLIFLEIELIFIKNKTECLFEKAFKK